MSERADGRRATIAIASLLVGVAAAVGGTLFVRHAVRRMPALPGDGRLPAAIRAGRAADDASVRALDSTMAAVADSAERAMRVPAGAPARASTPTTEIPTRAVPLDAPRQPFGRPR